MELAQNGFHMNITILYSLHKFTIIYVLENCSSKLNFQPHYGSLKAMIKDRSFDTHF